MHTDGTETKEWDADKRRCTQIKTEWIDLRLSAFICVLFSDLCLSVFIRG
jgi:hypothetical protein